MQVLGCEESEEAQLVEANGIGWCSEWIVISPLRQPLIFHC